MSPRRLIPLLLLSLPLAAQTHRVATPERVTRAIGVFEWTGDIAKPSAARLVPVAIFTDNRLEDAGVYLARPVPFALNSGNVYSIERAGTPIGTLDVDAATRVASRFSAEDNALTAWYGLGRFTAPPTEAELAAKQKKLNASAKVGTITGAGADTPTDDDTPHFVFRKPADTPTPDTTASKPTKPAPDDAPDSDRPTLRHRDPNVDTNKKPKREKPAGYVTGPSGSLNDDPDRPTLQRGDAATSTLTPELRGLPANMRQAVAVSDAKNADTHPFARDWDSPSERLTILSTLQDLARPRITNYLTRNNLIAAATAPDPPPDATPIPAPTKPTTSSPSDAADDTAAHPSLRRTPNGVDTSTSTPTPTPPAAAPTPAPAKTVPNISASDIPQKPPTRNTQKSARKPLQKTKIAPQIVLSREQLSSFQLTYGGLPTFIYTTEVPVTAAGPVYLTLVAQRIPSGEIQVSLSSITDATHLNRTPWLRPIDVVDPDDSHRASLLFELRAQHSRQFGLYQLVTAQAEQTFLTGIIE